MNNEGTMKTFMKGAVLLTMAGLIVKLLSAVYRVPYQNMVGDQGFYIYQQVYPFIGIFSTWTSYGFAVAVSKLMADSEERDHGSILRIAFGFIAVISTLFFLVLFFGANFLAGWMGDGQLSSLLQVGAFAVLLMPPLAVLKGFFQSNNEMAPVAYSQITEQGIRVTVILLGTWIVISSGFSLYAAGQMAMFGAVAGEIAGVILLVTFFRKRLFKFNSPSKLRVWPVIKNMTAISLSISMSSLILLFFQLADSFTIFRLLTESGIERTLAMEQKGVYDRGQPLVQFGILIATSLALTIVPLVAHMSKKESGRSAQMYAGLAFRISFLFAFAAAAGLTFVMPYVNEMLFQTRDESLTLIIFSWQIVWMSLLLVMTAMLHGLGKVKVPALLLTGGLLIKILGNWLLVPIWDVTGAAVAGNLGLAFIVIGLLQYFKKVWPIRFAPSRYYGWIAVSTAAMGIVVAGWALFSDIVLFDGAASRISAMLTSLTAVPLGAAAFLLLIAKSRIITEKEWYIIPFGRKLAGLQLRIRQQKRG
ncbi:putative polysaccharide biosynthesis protein [Planococcus shenhongbingii]|uniref:Polysaccharide biosynthesis protein n=1 Tax=Planococcus shenhongbingii TaxID=3058398 RepID=A0ABT8NIS5_9BACL|nr:polysaccharide biosynthesis protein [Planococcus sp. N017]MDN7247567.1 polysaccharide biosynthesis protein [Planococcus sp. N017]